MNAMSDRCDIVLSVLRALLGVVTPQVRRIDVFWNGTHIHIRLEVERAGGATFADDLADAEAEVLGDFPSLTDVTSAVRTSAAASPAEPGTFDAYDRRHCLFEMAKPA